MVARTDKLSLPAVTTRVRNSAPSARNKLKPAIRTAELVGLALARSSVDYTPPPTTVLCLDLDKKGGTGSAKMQVSLAAMAATTGSKFWPQSGHTEMLELV